jgi:predicted component of type VI protein secretion system
MFKRAQKLFLALFIVALVFSACSAEYEYTPKNTQQETETFTKEDLFPEKDTSESMQTVYVTRTGAKYHTEYCQYLKSSKIPIELNDAKTRGYTPCKVCKPPY